MGQGARLPALIAGVLLILLYCVLATMADAATKVVAHRFAAPQLFFFSGAVGMALSYAMMRRAPGPLRLRPAAPRLLALRSALFVVSCLCYFYAFASLVFVEVFAFIALVPVIAALLSSPILGETVRPFCWLALLAGAGGMVIMHPDGLQTVTAGHFFALMGATTGSVSMVLARLISRYERNSLLQVFYPNLAICVIMMLALPFVYQPMPGQYFALILGYGGLLFAARWVLVLALSRLPAYVVTPLINLQFVMMLAVGYAAFGEVPSTSVISGSVLIITAGIMLVAEQYRSAKAPELQQQVATAQ